MTPTETAAALAEAVRAFLQWITHNAKLGTNGLVQALAAYDAARAVPAKQAEDLLEAAKREYPRDKNLLVQLCKLIGSTGYSEIKGAEDNPAKIQHAPKEPAKPGDWMRNAAKEINSEWFGGEQIATQKIISIIAKHAPAQPSEVSARELSVEELTQWLWNQSKRTDITEEEEQRLDDLRKDIDFAVQQIEANRAAKTKQP